MERMPALFIGHGSPMNIVLKNSYTDHLAKLGRDLPRPEAVLVVSAHWLTEETCVTCLDDPPQIYDFYGFPRELYELRYPAKGSSEIAAMVADMTETVRIEGSAEWGLDHASWAVLAHMFPSADIPVIELSVNMTKPASYHYKLGRELAPLRERGVLVIGSGNAVHNLRAMESDIDAEPYEWAAEADGAIQSILAKRDAEKLIDYRSALPHSGMAVPTPDHYLPMLYTLGMMSDDDPLVFTHEGIQYASVSMRCFRVG